MTTGGLHLDHPPIIEAILDIHCDLPPAMDLAALQERATQALGGFYPKARGLITQSHEFRAGAEEPPQLSGRHQVGGLQFLTEDEKQVVQIREEGYSFNRLAPYSSLDDYLPEIERTWNVFRELTGPVLIRFMTLRFINRILLPTIDGRVELNDYLRVSPQLPDDTLEFTGFLNQHSAFEVTTGNQVKIALVTQPLERDRLPVILDIQVSDPRPRPPEDWQGVREAILALRRLKNRVFEGTLNSACLNLFRQP